MHAYSEMYVDDAMDNLGEAIDYAYQCCNISLSKFMDYFIVSGLAHEFEIGSPRVVTGMSGTELTMEILRKTFDYEATHEFPPAQIEYDYSEEYWTGWILAFYQWSRGVSFRFILDRVSIETIRDSYHPLHEASEEIAADHLDSLIIEKHQVNKLQTARRLMGYTQRILAEKSGVNLRTLQQYEIGSKSLDKASGATLLALSKELGCRMEDLI